MTPFYGSPFGPQKGLLFGLFESTETICCTSLHSASTKPSLSQSLLSQPSASLAYDSKVWSLKIQCSCPSSASLNAQQHQTFNKTLLTHYNLYPTLCHNPSQAWLMTQSWLPKPSELNDPTQAWLFNSVPTNPSLYPLSSKPQPNLI